MMMINLTQHPATPDQVEREIFDVEDPIRLRALLTIQVGGPMGIAENLSAASKFLEQRARMIVTEFVLPILYEQAYQQLHAGGYTTTGEDAWQMLRPEVSANGLKALVGGMPPLIDRLVKELRRIGVTPYYALSDRVSVETTGPDGTVTKTQVFKHLGEIEA